MEVGAAIVLVLGALLICRPQLFAALFAVAVVGAVIFGFYASDRAHRNNVAFCAANPNLHGDHTAIGIPVGWTCP